MKDYFAGGHVRGMVAYLPRWLRASYKNLGKEYIVSCPKCKTFETLFFGDGVMTPTKKFRQRDDRKVYHDCGSELPCQLFCAVYTDGRLRATKVLCTPHRG